MSSTDFAPSAFGFRSIKPKTRIERRNMVDKVACEKQRLNARVGFEARLNQANCPETSAGLTTCATEGAGYISNSDRFHSDTAGEEFQQRQDIIRKRNAAIEFRKNQAQVREEERWRQLESKRTVEEERLRQLRDRGTASKKNTSAVAYDILNLDYHQNVQGEQQKHVDDMVRYRAAVRSRNLVIQGDSRLPFNIINGDRRDIPSYPQEVPPQRSLLTDGAPGSVRGGGGGGGGPGTGRGLYAGAGGFTNDTVDYRRAV